MNPGSYRAGGFSTGVVQNDLPALRAFAPDEGEDAVVFFGVAVGGAVEVKAAGDYGKLYGAAGAGQEADFEVREGERAHLLGGGIGLCVALEDGTVAFAQRGADEGGFRRVFIDLHEGGNVGAVPGGGLGGHGGADGGFV